MGKTRWVLWYQEQRGAEWALRRGRYASREAAEDAICNLSKSLSPPAFRFLALPEGKEPQDRRG